LSVELGPIPQHSSSIRWNNFLECFRSKFLTPVCFFYFGSFHDLCRYSTL